VGRIWKERIMRGYRTDAPVYFGLPGQLISMPWPRGGMSPPVDREVFDFQSGSGGHRISTLVGTSRSYALTWGALHQSTFDKINAYWVGAMGPGPFCIIDPSRPNLLTVNQAAATAQWNDATDFTLGGVNHGTLSSNKTTTQIHRTNGVRSLQWLFSGSLSYTFAFWCKPDGVVDSNITAGSTITWYDVTGAVISTSTLAGVAVTAWTQKVLTAIAPSTAAYGLPAITVTSSTVTSGGSLYVDELVYEQDSVANEWAPGTGVYPVGITNWTEAVPFDALFRVSPVLSLREVK
jgi:hypothetical protein